MRSPRSVVIAALSGSADRAAALFGSGGLLVPGADQARDVEEQEDATTMRVGRAIVTVRLDAPDTSRKAVLRSVAERLRTAMGTG